MSRFKSARADAFHSNATPTAIAVDNLSKAYGSTRAVRDVSFSVRLGETFGIAGPNGAGKTTTVECIEGLVRPDSGSVTVLGLDPWRDRRELRRVLGAQLQESRLPGKLRVTEALSLYASFYPDPEPIAPLLGRVGLGDKLHADFDHLSGGEQQRLSIALALVGRPQVAILDELTSGLDPRARREIWDLVSDLKRAGVTTILVTHFMEEAERLCDRLAFIDKGRVVAIDSPTGLIGRVPKVQRLVFRPSEPFSEQELAALPSVDGVSAADGQVTVAGREGMLEQVVAALAKTQVAPLDLRVSQPTLEDAFFALTGRNSDADPEPPAGEQT